MFLTSAALSGTDTRLSQRCGGLFGDGHLALRLDAIRRLDREVLLGVTASEVSTCLRGFPPPC